MSRIVLITGAAQGIGFEMSRQFAEHGDTVIMSDLNNSLLSSAHEQLSAQYFTVSASQLDVTNESEVARVIETVISKHGRIDILINNAGVQFVAPIEDFPTEKFEQLIKVMLVAPFMLTKHVFPSMKQQRFGRIINMASINGLIGFAGKAAYNSAKHGVIGLTKVAALEAAEYNITVNALCPGYVDTELVRQQLSALSESRKIPVAQALDEVLLSLVPQKRLLAAEEVAHYVLFLCDEKAKGITGQAIVIDGGYTAQ